MYVREVKNIQKSAASGDRFTDARVFVRMLIILYIFLQISRCETIFELIIFDTYIGTNLLQKRRV